MVKPDVPVVDETPDSQPSVVIEYVNPRSLKPDPNQPRRDISEEEINDMAASITRLETITPGRGVIKPIEVNGDNIIVTGELRWRGALKAGLKTVPILRVTGLTPAQRFLRQVIENLQHNELGDRDASNALVHLRDLRRQGELPMLEVPVTSRYKNPKGGRPPGFEPGSTRELALLVGKSAMWVSRRISDAYVDPDDVPPTLQTALSEDQLTKDAVAIIRRRCPPAHRQSLIDKLAEETTRGFVPTQAVRAVVAGLCAEQNDQDKAEQLINLIQGGEKGSFTEAQVQVLAPDAVIDSAPKSKSSAAPPRRRGPEDAVIRHGLDFVRAVEHVGEAADSRNLVQALRSVHGAAGQLLDRLGYAPKERATPPESRPLSPPPPPDPRLDGLKTRQFTLFRILQDVNGPLNKDQLLERLGYGDDYHPDRLEVDMTELERRDLVIGEGVGVWRAMKPEKPSY